MFDYIGVFHATTTRAAIIHILSTGSPNVGLPSKVLRLFLVIHPQLRSPAFRHLPTASVHKYYWCVLYKSWCLSLNNVVQRCACVFPVVSVSQVFWVSPFYQGSRLRFCFVLVFIGACLSIIDAIAVSHCWSMISTASSMYTIASSHNKHRPSVWNYARVAIDLVRLVSKYVEGRWHWSIAGHPNDEQVKNVTTSTCRLHDCILLSAIICLRCWIAHASGSWTCILTSLPVRISSYPIARSLMYNSRLSTNWLAARVWY